MGGLKHKKRKTWLHSSPLFSLFLQLGERPSLNLHYAHRDFLSYAVEYLILHKTSWESDENVWTERFLPTLMTELS